ncbi:MAG TPA: HlyD family type I secretion periplasmic adaptor subunit [Xanthobacteraceae bacterium]|nr:HlyD family type I secretion periplasmic adaptor subunit [Xanthobacteraceae bacterium]
MQRSDFSFANDIRAATELRTPQTSRMLLFTTLGFLFVAIIWANFAILDEVKRGNGRVIPSRQTQVVQTLEGGIVGSILVREGDIVNQGEPLMRIDDTKFAAEFGEVRERRAAMAARVVRLEAEAQGQDSVTFPPDLVQIAPGPVSAEKSVFETHARKLAQDIDVLMQDQNRLSESLKLLDREVELTRPLFQQKVVPEIEWVRLQQREADMRGQLAGVQSKITNAKAAFRSQADDDLAKSRGDLAVLDENIKSAQDRVRRTELKSPVYGIVNKLNVTTIGAVVQPGANVMDIIPLDDTLLVEGRIRPQDIAFIRPNQPAVVKITAYDSSVYGTLKGHVERISADTIIDDKSQQQQDQQQRPENFYRVIVRTDKNYLGSSEHPLPIIPGMVTTVEIMTGEKSVLDYMMKPARMLRDEALRER